MKITADNYVFEYDERENDLYVISDNTEVEVTNHKLILALMRRIEEQREQMEVLAKAIHFYEELVS